MRLRGVRRSRNVIDRRGRGGRVAAGGGIGIVGLLGILAVGWLFGIDVGPILDIAAGQPPRTVQTEPRELTEAEREAGDFAAAVLGTTEDVWGRVFPEQLDARYAPPEMVLFSGAVQSGCGGASAATGPFYCPLDQRAYLDTAFFATMARSLGAKGDFAAAYVIAHEVGHHVQNELGILGQVREMQARAGQAEANALQVRVELMADCLSGIWAANVRELLEPGDVEEAIDAAKRIGDDHLARRAGRAVRPHTFKHGTSEQRARWFARGFESGAVGACDTFSAERL